MLGDWWLKFKLWRERNFLSGLHRIFQLYCFILVVWGFYRLLFRLPEWLEEFFLKPLVFVVPVVWLMRKEGLGLSQIGLVKQNWLKSAVWGVMAGMLYSFLNLAGLFLGAPGLLMKSLEGSTLIPFNGVLVLTSFILLALATAFWEQLVFSGFILHRLITYWKNEVRAVMLTAILFMLIHVPILFFASSIGWIEGTSQLVLLFIVGMGNGYLVMRTKNLTGSIVAGTLLGFSGLIFR